MTSTVLVVRLALTCRLKSTFKPLVVSRLTPTSFYSLLIQPVHLHVPLHIKVPIFLLLIGKWIYPFVYICPFVFDDQSDLVAYLASYPTLSIRVHVRITIDS